MNKIQPGASVFVVVRDHEHWDWSAMHNLIGDATEQRGAERTFAPMTNGNHLSAPLFGNGNQCVYRTSRNHLYFDHEVRTRSEQLIANLASPKVKWTPEIRERLLTSVASRISARKAR